MTTVILVCVQNSTSHSHTNDDASQVESNLRWQLKWAITDLHSDNPIFDLHFFCQAICSNGGLTLIAQLFINILIHQRCLSNPARSTGEMKCSPRDAFKNRKQSSACSNLQVYAYSAHTRRANVIPAVTFNKVRLRPDIVASLLPLLLPFTFFPPPSRLPLSTIEPRKVPVRKPPSSPFKIKPNADSQMKSPRHASLCRLP